jgi:CheY-like chemotaxis protein
VDAAGPLVLVIDDDRLVLRAWTRLLASLPVRLRCEAEPAEAVRAIREEPPAVVVSDHHMAGMTGLELLACVRVLDPSIGVVLVTTDADALREAARRGYRVFEKGSPPEELRAIVAALAG